MTRTELIVRTASKLPYQERVNVARQLMERPEENPDRDPRNRYATLVKVAEEVVGQKMSGSRDWTSVMIRRFVAYRMRAEGHYISDISRAMGKHHSTVIHYVKQMKDCFDEPIFYAADLALYMKFTEYVDDESALAQP